MAFVPLGTAPLAGPGAIVATMLVVQRTGFSGLLLSAIAVQLVAEAVRAFVTQG